MTGLVAFSTGTIAAIVAVVVVDLFAIFLGLSIVRSRRAAAAADGAVAGVPAPKAPKPVSRREFFRKSLIGSLLVYGAQFGGATIAFLWPNLKGGFGSVVRAGKLADIQSSISETKQPYYFGSGRFYLVGYEGQADGGVDYAANGVAAQGIMPLYQRCVHLGCRVPYCASSGWFECPCHGSKYNGAGEYKLGPAPRGMDRFRIEVTDAQGASGLLLVARSPRGYEGLTAALARRVHGKQLGLQGAKAARRLDRVLQAFARIGGAVHGGDLRADGENRIKAGHRVLENHRNALTADFAQLAVRYR